MPDDLKDDEGALDRLIEELLKRGLEHVRATPAEDWVQILTDWNGFIVEEIVGIVELLDGDPLRALAAESLDRLVALRRTELLGEAFPTLRFSEN